jgi:hypothetical protein
VTEIRPEVVAGVRDGNPLATENCTWAEQREGMRLRALRSIALGHGLLVSLGYDVDQVEPSQHVARFVRSSHVADATFIEAVAMWRQTAAYDSTMRLLMSWWPHQAEDKTLGELLQAMPADAAAEVVEHLRRAGFRDPPDVDGGRPS